LKKTGNLLSFFFFGLVAQWILLVLLGKNASIELFYNFLLAGTFFMIFRELIEEKEKEGVVSKELRKYVVRNGSAFRLAFAVVTACGLVVANLTLSLDLTKVFTFGVIAVIFTEVIFGTARDSWNFRKSKLNSCKKNFWEVKKVYG